MTDTRRYGEEPAAQTSTSGRLGFTAAMVTAVVAGIAFGLALIAVPVSGENCPGNCVSYPYLDTVSRFPRDFLWMPAAILLALACVALMAAIHASAPAQTKGFSQVGLSFALLAAVILASDYYIQFSVIPMSLLSGETEGLAMLIQYNPHSVFIMLEELGYLAMSLAFVFMAPVFAGRSRLEAAVRWVFVLAFALAFGALAVIDIRYGFGRGDRLEVALISIDWLALIVNGILLSVWFGRQMRADKRLAG